MITQRFKDGIYAGTLAQFTASTKKWKEGDLLFVRDAKQIRFGTGTAVFTALLPIPITGIKQVPVMAALAGSVDVPTISAKVDALIAALKTANLMASV